MRKIVVDREVLEHAIADGINIYIRDVLIPEGVVDEGKYRGDMDAMLIRRRDDVVKSVAQRWETSWAIAPITQLPQ